MRLAISKGRILEEALRILDRCGIECNESPLSSRKLIFLTNKKQLEIIVIRASDVPVYIESGKSRQIVKNLLDHRKSHGIIKKSPKIFKQSHKISKNQKRIV